MTSIVVPEHVLYGLIVEFEIAGRQEQALGVRELARTLGFPIVEKVVQEIKRDVMVARPVFSLN